MEFPQSTEELGNNGYTSFYTVRITDYPFEAQDNRGLYNCVWEMRDLEGSPKTAFIEPQDFIVDDVIRRMNGDGLPFDGRVCLQTDENDVNTTMDRKDSRGNPDKIVSYHPLIYIPSGNRPLNIGQLGDVHVTARHQILSKSNARVIDYDCTDTATLTAPADDPSPQIGSLVNVATKNLKELLDKMGNDSDLLFGDDDRVTEPFGTRVIERFQSDDISMDLDDMGDADIPFTITLSRYFRNMIGIDAVSFFAYLNQVWTRIDLHLEGGRWVIYRGVDAGNFRRAFFQNRFRSRFVSIRFRNPGTHPEIAHYNFDSRWNFEIEVDEDESGGFLGIGDTHRSYRITRNEAHAEFPDFGFRERLVKYR
jgi:hypothetical protein